MNDGEGSTAGAQRRVLEAAFPILKAVYRLVIVGSYVLVSLHVFCLWIGFDAELRVHHTAVNDYKRARVPAMIYGRAYRPFVLRTLLPLTVRLVAAAVPNRMRRGTEDALLRAKSIPRLMSKLGWEEEYLLEYLIALALMYGCLLGFVFVLRDFFVDLYVSNGPVADIFPLVALFCLPTFFKEGTHYLYDFPTLLLSTMGLAMLHRKHWVSFYLVFLLATVNKETAVLLVLVFATCYWGRKPSGDFWRHVAAQLFLFAAVRLAILYAYRENPGTVVESHLSANLSLTLERPDYPTYCFLAFILASLLLRREWAHWFLRGSLVLLIPMVPLYLAFGGYGEIRAFYEAFSILLLWTFDVVFGHAIYRRDSKDPRWQE